MKRRALVAAGLTAAAAVGALAAPFAARPLLRFAGWARTLTARKAHR